jgi:hypothetical protein
MLQFNMSWFRKTGMRLALVAMLFQAVVAGVSAAAASRDPGTSVPGAAGYLEICTRHGLMRVPVKPAPGAEAPETLTFGCDCTLCPVLGGGLTPPAEVATIWAPLAEYVVRLTASETTAGRPIQTGPPSSRAPPFIV